MGLSTQAWLPSTRDSQWGTRVSNRVGLESPASRQLCSPAPLTIPLLPRLWVLSLEAPFHPASSTPSRHPPILGLPASSLSEQMFVFPGCPQGKMRHPVSLLPEVCAQLPQNLAGSNLLPDPKTGSMLPLLGQGQTSPQHRWSSKSHLGPQPCPLGVPNLHGGLESRLD